METRRGKKIENDAGIQWTQCNDGAEKTGKSWADEQMFQDDGTDEDGMEQGRCVVGASTPQVRPPGGRLEALGSRARGSGGASGEGSGGLALGWLSNHGRRSPE